jgi:hypothetical protein
LIRRLREQQPNHFLHQSRQSLSHNSRFSLAQKSCIESRIASPGNRTLGGGQASENIALTRDDVLAKLHCISITAAHNVVGPCNASRGKFFLVLCRHSSMLFASTGTPLHCFLSSWPHANAVLVFLGLSCA